MIGTASIVIMVSLGLGINEQFSKQMESYGDATLITINNWGGYSYNNDTGEYTQTERVQLNDEAIARFEALPGVIMSTPFMQNTLYLKSGKYMAYMSCYGIKPEALPLLGYTAAQGRMLEKNDEGTYAALFGSRSEYNFRSESGGYEDRYWQAYMGEEVEHYVDVMNDRIRKSPNSAFLYNESDPSKELDPDDLTAPKPIKPYELDVVGVMQEVRDDWMTMDYVYLDITTFKALMKEMEEANKQNNQQSGYISLRKDQRDTSIYDQAYIKCADLESTKTVAETIKNMGFQGNYLGEYIDQQMEFVRILQMLLAAIGGVSLFVAAIGIANTMVMSIYERTREIGVMKVIGASIRDIRWLFLLESALLGLIGGVFGLGISLILAHFVNTMDLGPILGNIGIYVPRGESVGSLALITPWLCGVALAFSSLVGLVSGYFPARRATKLSALSAIRTE
jgi:ABC-type antimicrobial peptide transport system permease subunit